jgi:hypothetical protein
MLCIAGLDIDEMVEFVNASWMSAAGRSDHQDLFQQTVEEVGSLCVQRSQRYECSPRGVWVCLWNGTIYCKRCAQI